MGMTWRIELLEYPFDMLMHIKFMRVFYYFYITWGSIYFLIQTGDMEVRKIQCRLDCGQFIDMLRYPINMLSTMELNFLLIH
jgi:hypothetical protein